MHHWTGIFLEVITWRLGINFKGINMKGNTYLLRTWTMWHERSSDLLNQEIVIERVIWKAKKWVLVTWSCPTLCDPLDCSPPGSSVYRISQARILEWVVTSFFRGCSQSRDQILVSCIGRWILYHSATREAQYFTTEKKKNNWSSRANISSSIYRKQTNLCAHD